MISITETATDLITVTATQQVTVTTVTGAAAQPPFKRVATLETLDNSRPTKIPITARACTDAAAFSSACSCIGVTASTITAAVPVTTSVVTRTVSVVTPVTKVVDTVLVTATAQTDKVTSTYSTELLTTVVDTVEVDVTVATQTVTATSTKAVPNSSVQTVSLAIVGSADPALSALGGSGFAAYESYLGSNVVYYLDFTTDVTGQHKFALDVGTGAITSLDGPAGVVGETLFYNPSGTDLFSYARFAPTEVAESAGNQAVVCKIATTGLNSQYLQCKGGDNQIADLWTCKQRLVLVRPGLDFSRQCRDASTAYRISWLLATPA